VILDVEDESIKGKTVLRDADRLGYCDMNGADAIDAMAT